MLYLDTSAVKGDECLMRSLPGCRATFWADIITSLQLAKQSPISTLLQILLKFLNSEKKAFAAFMERLALIFMAAEKTVQNKKLFSENPLLMSVFYIKKAMSCC